MATKKIKVPKTLGACADKLYKLHQEKVALNRKVEVIAAQQTAIKEHLIQKLPKSKAEGVLGKLAKAEIKTKEVPSVKDWDKFRKFILKTKDFSFLGRKVSAPAIQDRWDDGKKVPGVVPFTVIRVSVTKR